RDLREFVTRPLAVPAPEGTVRCFPALASCGATVELFELRATALGQLMAVKSLAQVDEATPQLFGAHLLRAKVFVVFACVRRRSHARERQETQARKRCDDFAAFYKAGQCHAETHQLGIACPYPAHGDQADLHRQNPRIKKSDAPTIRKATGMKKNR